MIQVGDIRFEQPFCAEGVRKGKVVYVNHARRWYLVEFVCERLGMKRKYREGFYLPLEQDANYKPDRGSYSYKTGR